MRTKLEIGLRGQPRQLFQGALAARAVGQHSVSFGVIGNPTNYVTDSTSRFVLLATG